MKRTLLAILFAITSSIVFGQARLGSSASDIKSEFWESHYKLKSGYDKDGDYYITIVTERATVTYYFNSDKVCYLTAIIPDNQGALNFYVELYNKQYVIVSSKQWKMYSENGIANIKLIYPEGGGYYFLWSN
ncbi:MAG: hypothetical protein JST10_10135 [Bacteroidetes bacterium]|nr:hypothetical protein [Bacteroidota bacterium]